VDFDEEVRRPGRYVGRGGGRGMVFTAASPVTEKVTAFISVGRDIFVSGNLD
jgi:hypothetical protein